jgi:hypothetical protein
MKASDWGREEVVKQLVAAGADVHLSNEVSLLINIAKVMSSALDQALSYHVVLLLCVRCWAVWMDGAHAGIKRRSYRRGEGAAGCRG